MKKRKLKLLAVLSLVILVMFGFLFQSCNNNDSTPATSITDFSPMKDTIDATITITGSNFDATANNNIVLINNVAATVTSATTQQLKVTVPSGATTGKISVTAHGKTILSSTDFQVIETGLNLFFSEYSPKKVSYFKLGTSSPVTIADSPNKGLNNPTGIVVSKTDYVYIAEEVGDRIVRIKKDGSGTLEVLFDTSDGISNPTSIAIDEVNNVLYWNNSGTDQIMKGNPDGSGSPSTLYGGAKVDSYGYGMALDVPNNKIYFSDFSSHPYSIGVGKLDGTGIPDTLFSEKTVPNFGCPSNIALDSENGRIYWSDECGGNIAYGKTDGTGTQTVLFNSADDGVSSADGIVIDIPKGKVYWSNNSDNVISVGNLDGSGTPKNIISNVSPYYFFLEYKK